MQSGHSDSLLTLMVPWQSLFHLIKRLLRQHNLKDSCLMVAYTNSYSVFRLKIYNNLLTSLLSLSMQQNIHPIVIILRRAIAITNFSFVHDKNFWCSNWLKIKLEVTVNFSICSWSLIEFATASFIQS